MVTKGLRAVAAIVVGALLLGIIDLVGQRAGPTAGSGRIRLVLLSALALLLVYLVLVIRSVARAGRELELRDRELMALHAAALDVHRNLSLEVVLQRVVDHARELVGARYGALSVIGEDNRIRAFLTSGISPAERLAIGSPPTGRGLLGVVLHEGRHLRLADIGADPRRAGFPPNHPPMRSLLAVPIPSQGAFQGNLYLTEKTGGAEFSGADEQILARFAVAASNAIDNAGLHEKLRSLAVAEERVRIAHELHDGMAQVLAYVNAKAQAVGEFLRSGRAAEAEKQLEQLAAAAREVYADTREGILGLRAVVGDQPLGRALADYLERWQEQSGVEVRSRGLDGGRVELGPVAELQLMRIVQESLANVRKHAGASHVEVTLEQNGDVISATVADDGRGFDPDNMTRHGLPRFGLATMRERAESVGGSLRVESTPGGGTRMRVELPVDTTAAVSGGNDAHSDRR